MKKNKPISSLMYRYFSCLLLVFIAVSCKKNEQFNGYTKDDNGYYFKLLGIGDGNDLPKNNSVLVVEAVMKTMSDSIFWDTSHDAVNGLFIPVNSTKQFGSCNAHFYKMVQGDSASFLVTPSSLFKDYFNSPVPDFCIKDSLIKFDVKISQIISNAEYESIKKMMSSKEAEDTELQELKLIDSYLKTHYKNTKVDENGIYIIEKTTTHLAPVSYGKLVKFEYKGSYLDGRPLEGPKQELEFVYGTPDQIIKGLNIVIGTLKKGETTKIIVPSRLAFGEFGSSNGSIAPYTPLVYEIKIIDIK